MAIAIEIDDNVLIPLHDGMAVYEKGCDIVGGLNDVRKFGYRYTGAQYSAIVHQDFLNSVL